MITANHLESAGSSPDEPRPAARRGTRARPLLLGISLGLLAALITVVGVALVMRRSRPQLTEAVYQAAVERWEKHGPRSYELDLELSGNRSGQIHIEVRDGEVTHMTRDGIEPKQRRTWDYWSVPGQLETIGQELDMARDPANSFKSKAVTGMVMWAEFDPQYGYPLVYDRVVLGGDFEVHWRITRFDAISAETPSPRE
jgi:hypothetical protein